ncbi:hypothetical protein MGAST_16745 [Mycobacterium gastri 'Wayne']|nr:hypothetical protein MGAST_16745 [Mycobacterium gastri 'Wayne']
MELDRDPHAAIVRSEPWSRDPYPLMRRQNPAVGVKPANGRAGMATIFLCALRLP